MDSKKFTQWGEALHFPLWIAKDAAWFFGLGWTSLLLAIPVIAISVIVTLSNKGLSRWEWGLLTLWLVANTVWMSSELIDPGVHSAAQGIWAVSLLAIPFYINYLRKHFRDR